MKPFEQFNPQFSGIRSTVMGTARKKMYCYDAFNSWSSVHPIPYQPRGIGCSEPKQPSCTSFCGPWLWGAFSMHFRMPRVCVPTTWVVSVGIHVHLAAPRWMPIDRALQPRQRRADKFTFEKNFMGIGQLHSAKRRRRSEQRLLQMPLARGVHVLRWNVYYITTTAIMVLGCHLSRDFSIILSKEELLCMV